MDIEAIPTSQPTPGRAERVSATFFLTGDFAAANPGAVQALISRRLSAANPAETSPVRPAPLGPPQRLRGHSEVITGGQIESTP